ncbi:putative exported protein [Plasmodium gaboni]|uniref:Putative exported protein n=1 Tax=Plasmodium gaboni TaxID=647221 RepID=A0A151L2N7_9APIC|nr:putative exported protein [Plasmodium gaboni]KYN93221.1 putative exported protein [Plasmodium gaboni]
MVLISIKCLLFFMCLFVCNYESYNNPFEQRIYKNKNLINNRINRKLATLNSTQNRRNLGKTKLNLKCKDDLNESKNCITISDKKGKKENKENNNNNNKNNNIFNNSNDNNYDVYDIEEEVKKTYDNLEQLIEQNVDEPEEIYNKEKKSFFKRSFLLLKIFDNIFIQKTIDSRAQNQRSDIHEDIKANLCILSAGIPMTAIPIYMYLIKRMDFFCIKPLTEYY